jgi:Xaa-Pro aminopeptidase
VDEHVNTRLRAAMDDRGLDALIAYSKENVAYGVGYTIPSQALGVRNRQFALVVNRDGEAALLLTSNEMTEARERSAVRELRPYDEFNEDPMQVLAGVLEELGVAGGRVGVEMDAMPADRWEALKRTAPGARLEPAGHAFEQARMIKSPAELERLRAACAVADIAQAEAHAQVREGMTEQDVYRIIVDRALAHGADEVLLVQVAAGERSAFSNPAPSTRKLRRGDVVKIDTFVSVGGYLSDTGRAVVVGEASARQRDIWRRMQETLAEVENFIRPGVTAREVWETFVDSFARRDMRPAIRFLGHGLGLSLHEEPFVAAHSDTVLEAGMVLAVEPIFEADGVGYHLEDNLIVTDLGVENMTSQFGPDLITVGNGANRT